MVNRPQLTKLAERTRRLSPLAVAVVFPVDADSLQVALSGAFAGYLAPTLVGPEARIRDTALRTGLDITRLPLIDTADEPRAAGERAVQLASAGEVGALIKGTLANDDLLGPVAEPGSGLRTDRRLTHVYFLDLPGQLRGLVLTDALLNLTPNLAAKRDIVANAVRFATALEIATPNVALLAPRNFVVPAFASTSEAAALKSMAAQGFFGDAIIDGPITPDIALNADAQRVHGVQSNVAGRADILVAPDQEAATMVLRTLTGITGGLAAGLVVGAKVPIVSCAQHDPMEVRMASCVLASLVCAASSVAGHDAQAAANGQASEGARRVAA